MSKNDLIFNEDKNRYEQEFADGIVYARIHEAGNVTHIDFVQADPALRGTGAASTFMTSFMGKMKADDRKVMPVCGYARKWLDRHNEYDGLIQKF